MEHFFQELVFFAYAGVESFFRHSAQVLSNSAPISLDKRVPTVDDEAWKVSFEGTLKLANQNGIDWRNRFWFLLFEYVWPVSFAVPDFQTVENE